MVAMAARAHKCAEALTHTTFQVMRTRPPPPRPPEGIDAFAAALALALALDLALDFGSGGETSARAGRRQR